VVIVSQSIAQRFFPNGDALNRHLSWTDPSEVAWRIVGVAADVDDERVDGQPAMTFYRPVRQFGFGGRLFVRAAGDPHALVPAVTRIIHEIAADQPVERAATLEDIRAEVLSPERVKAFVFSGFAGIALLIALVGVAGVLAFLVSARTRELGMRLAVGCPPQQLLTHVLSEGTTIATIGIAAGALGGFVLARVATRLFTSVQLPGALTVGATAAVLLAAAVVASWVPAARASRIDVIEALRAE
jgi:putative ABC transport system permease protein